MFCTRCGKPYPDGSRFCVYCGFPTENVTAPAVQARGAGETRPAHTTIPGVPDHTLIPGTPPVFHENIPPYTQPYIPPERAGGFYAPPAGRGAQAGESEKAAESGATAHTVIPGVPENTVIPTQSPYQACAPSQYAPPQYAPPYQPASVSPAPSGQPQVVPLYNGRGEITGYAPYEAARKEAPKRSDGPAVKMRRAYNLSTLATLLTMGAQSEFSQIVITVIAFVAVIAGLATGVIGGAEFQDPKTLIKSFLDNDRLLFAVRLVYVLVYAFAMVGGILIASLVRKRVKTDPVPKKNLTFGQFVMVVFAAFGLWGVGVIIGNFPAFTVPNAFGYLDPSEVSWSNAPMWALAIFGAPIFEELIFRKFMLDRLRPYGERTAIVFTALLFGMAHQNGGQFFLAFFIGLLFALVYLRTGKIGYTMFLHFMINTTATLTEAGVLIFGGWFNSVGWIIAGALTLIGVIVLLACRKNAFFKTEPNHIEGAGKAAYRGWGMILATVIVCITIALYGVVFAVQGAVKEKMGALSLLYFIPAALAIVTILVVSARAARRTVPAVAKEGGESPEEALENSGAQEETQAAPREGAIFETQDATADAPDGITENAAGEDAGTESATDGERPTCKEGNSATPDEAPEGQEPQTAAESPEGSPGEGENKQADA